MLKRILVIQEQIGYENKKALALVGPYIDNKIMDGVEVVQYKAAHHILGQLLEEEELTDTKVSQSDIDIMYSLNSFDKVVYVPQEANVPADILIYDPEKLDKNMIYYHIEQLEVEEIEQTSSSDEPTSYQKPLDVELEEKYNSLFWLMVSFVPWIIFLLMSLLLYPNITVIPLGVSLVILLIKALPRKKGREYYIEIGNVIFFIVASIANGYSSSWLASVSIPLGIMGFAVLILSYRLDFTGSNEAYINDTKSEM